MYYQISNNYEERQSNLLQKHLEKGTPIATHVGTFCKNNKPP